MYDTTNEDNEEQKAESEPESLTNEEISSNETDLTSNEIELSGEQISDASQPQVHLTLEEAKRIIEAFLFASDKPLTLQKIKSLLEISDSKSVLNLINELKDEYDREGKSFRITEIAGGYQIFTRDKYAPWIKKLIQSRSEKKLSSALLETLAIIAYKQPLSRLEIEAIRGVGASSALKLLMDKKLVKVVGKKEGIGRTLLYGTTKEFLIYFGLKSLDELPQLNELKDIMKQENPIELAQEKEQQ